MKTYKLQKIISCVMTGMIIATFMESQNVFASETVIATNSGQNIGTESQIPIKSKDRVSVHDPSIVKDGDTYYVFGSHIEAAKSRDLQNWTKFTNSYDTPNNVIFGDLSSNLAESFKWAGENDSDSKGGYSVWAPNVVWNKDYVNKDGSKGAYMMYYCTSSTYKRSAIGFATSKTIEGPYTYGNTVLYSGFTKGDAYDSNSTINTNYNNTNIKKLIENGTLSETSSKWFTKDGSYNTSYAPNAIDPEIFWDADGTMWMNYGSWSGGIYMVKIDPYTGDVIYPGKDEDSDTVNPTDRYFGKRIAGGYTKSGEGAEIVYDEATGYYYLYLSYAGLAANGGYNIRMFRSKNPEGPYLDASGNNAALSGNVDNTNYGIKLIGNYKFNCNDIGYKAAGHNSSFIDSDGQMYLVYHTRFNNGTEEHEVRIHQMFINEEGWPVVAPYENSGDKISETGYSKDEIVGNYEFINHGKASNSAMLDTLNVKLNENNTVTGDVSGTWSIKDGSYYMNIVIDGVTYKGVFFKQQDESDVESKVMTFTAVGDNNECIWGSKLELSDEDAVEYAGKMLESEIPETTKNNITLPVKGAYDTSISWTSSDTDYLDKDGNINRKSQDKEVTLTAKISKGQSSLNKLFTVTVEGKLESLDKTPFYDFNFNDTIESEKTISSIGSRSGNGTLIGEASVTNDEERGNVLSIKNSKGAIKENYFSLPNDTFSNITDKGYTVSMWVNVNCEDPNYFEHSALFEANNGSQYPVTRISANLYGRINADAYADATEISKPLESNVWEYVTYTVNPNGIVVYVNGEEVSRQDKDISNCFKNNVISKMTNVSVGSGNIWGDADIADAKFDNVSVYDSALTDKEVEALYNKEILDKTN